MRVRNNFIIRHTGCNRPGLTSAADSAFGAVVYYSVTLFLENKGAAVRLPTRFHEYAVGRKQQDVKERLELLSKCDLLRHLPPEEIEAILPYVRPRRLDAGEILFRAGDQGDALYIVAHGSVKVLADCQESATTASRPIATLGEGQAFGEMALLTGGARTATIRAAANTELLEIGKGDFEQLVKKDRLLANAVQQLSHERAINNLSSSGLDPSTWVRIARRNLQHLSCNEAHTLLVETGHGAGLAIVLGNILDTIPGCLVIGAKFNGIASLSLTLMLGMFLGGIPEAAASASMLRKANYRPRTIFGLWSTVLVGRRHCRRGRQTAHWQPRFADSHLLSGDRRRRCFGPRCPCHDSRSHSWGRLSCCVADRRGFSICSLSRAVGSFLMLLPVLGLRGRINGTIMKPRHLPVKLSTERPQTQALGVRHGSAMRPTAGFPCLSVGLDHADHDRSSAAPPYFEISNTRRV